jgi:hypothetical protein
MDLKKIDFYDNQFIVNTQNSTWTNSHQVARHPRAAHSARGRLGHEQSRPAHLRRPHRGRPVRRQQAQARHRHRPRRQPGRHLPGRADQRHGRVRAPPPLERHPADAAREAARPLHLAQHGGVRGAVHAPRHHGQRAVQVSGHAPPPQDQVRQRLQARAEAERRAGEWPAA